MKVLIIILLVATVAWVWRGGSPAAKESTEGGAAASQQASPSFQGRWRNDQGNNFAFRENGSFQMSRRMEENFDGIKIAFSAGMRGKWQKGGDALTLTIDKVESVTVLSTTVEPGTFPSQSKADTEANKLRKSFPRQFTEITEGSTRTLGLQWQSLNQLVVDDGGGSIILTRVE